MQSNPGRDTGPELAVRRELFSRGRRFRVNCRPIPSLRRTADIVFTRRKPRRCIRRWLFLALMPSSRNYPQSNSEYWHQKFQVNRLRDAETVRILPEEGWTSIRVWEHEIPKRAADRIKRALGGSARPGLRLQ
jgi:DNA mismatch endonuclease (patch repair protein)